MSSLEQTRLDLHISERFDLGVQSVSVREKSSGPTVTCSHWIDNDRILIAGASDGSINVWTRKSKHDPRTHRIELVGHLGHVFKFLFLDMYDPPLLLSISADRTIRVWDIETRDVKQRCVQKLVGHGGSVTDITYVKGFILTCSTDKTVRVWVADPHRDLLKYPWFLCVQMINTFKAEPCALGCLVRATDTESTTVFVGDSKGRLYTLLPNQALYHVADKETKGLMGIGGDDKLDVFALAERRTRRIHKLGITAIMVISSEHMICTTSYDVTMQVHEVTGHNTFTIVNQFGKRFTGMEWNAHTRELIVVDEIGNIQFWNIYMERCLKSVKISPTRLVGVALGSFDKLVLTSISNVSLCRIVRATSFKETEGHTQPIVALTCTDFGDHNVFSAGADNAIRAWDVYDMACTSVLHEPSSEITSLLFIPRSLIIGTGHDDGTLTLWNVDSGARIRLKHHTNTVTALFWVSKPEKDYLITAGFDRNICTWDMTKRKAFTPFPEYVFEGSKKEILCISYHPGSNTMLSSGNDCVIHMWDLDSREYTGRLEGQADSVTRLAVDGNMVISGGDDGTIYIWDISHRFLVRTFDAFNQAVKDMVLVPQLGLVVCCSSDSIIMWNYVTGEQEKKLKSSKHFRCLMYHSAQHKMFAGTREGALLKFDLPKIEASTIWDDDAWANEQKKIIDIEAIRETQIPPSRPSSSRLISRVPTPSTDPSASASVSVAPSRASSFAQSQRSTPRSTRSTPRGYVSEVESVISDLQLTTFPPLHTK